MAATKGKDGGFYIGSTLVTFFDSWDLDASSQVEETTSYNPGSIIWKTVIKTIREWVANVSGTLDRSDTQQAALLDQLEDGVDADQAVRLSTNALSAYWYGNAVVSGFAIKHTVKSKVNVTFKLIGNGALAHTA